MTEIEKNFVKIHKNDDVDDLLLHASKYPEVDMKVVAEQIRGWQIASRKLPLWAKTDGVIYPPHLSMEQCSSEQTAAYKAELISIYQPSERPFCMTDLTGGFGVDAVMMARGVKNASVTYVERNPELCRLARHNFPLLGVRDFRVAEGDCEEELEDMVYTDLIYIDPARRDTHGRKTYAIEDCTPDVCRLQDRLVDIAPLVLIKLSPMLDLNDAVAKLKYLSEIHVVSVDGECKEVLVLLIHERLGQEGVEELDLIESSDEAIEPTIYCVNIIGDGTKRESFVFTREEEENANCHFADKPLSFLFEPNASVLKAGAFKSVACRYNLQKLHPNSHLYTSDIFQSEFSGRKFKVIDTFSFQKKDIKRLTASVEKANITVRNFPMSVADLRKRLKISEGGNDYLFATTLKDNSKVLILCKKLD